MVKSIILPPEVVIQQNCIKIEEIELMHDIKQLRLSHNKFRHLKKKPGGFADSSFSRCYAESKLCIQYTKAKAKIQAALKKLAGDWFNFSSAPEFFKIVLHQQIEHKEIKTHLCCHHLLKVNTCLKILFRIIIVCTCWNWITNHDCNCRSMCCSTLFVDRVLQHL